MELTSNTGSAGLPAQSQWAFRLVIVVAVSLLLAVAWFGWRWYVSYRIRKDLKDAIVEMDRTEPGWRLEDIEAARQGVLPDQNSALLVNHAASLQPADHTRKFTSIENTLRGAPLNRRLLPGQVKQLNEILNGSADALAVARGIENREWGRFVIVYSPDGFGTSLDHIDGARKVTQLLWLATRGQLEGGDLSEALLLARAQVNAGRAIGDEPIAISQMVRHACVSLGCESVVRILGHGTLELTDLSAIQTLLELEGRYDCLSIVLRGERACIHRMLQYVADGNVTKADVASMKDTFPQAEALLDRDCVRKDHSQMFAVMRRYLEIAKLPVPLRDQAMSEFDAEVQTMPITVLSFYLPAVDKFDKGIRRRHAYLHCTIAALACERHRLQHGRWPEKLEDIAPLTDKRFLDDPCDGNPLHYVRQEDGILIHSTASDGPNDSAKEKADIAVRLWDVKHRGLPPLAESPAP